MKGKNIGIWIRVSTSMQAQGDSPEHHEERARMYAQVKEWNVVEVYHLEAVSGKSVLDHAEAKRMLSDIRSGHIDGLIFSKIARLARNTKELLEFAEIFEENNAGLISLDESIDTSTPSGRFFYTLLSAMAQWEREEIAERVASSIPVRAKLGKFLGGRPPYGYKIVDKKLVIDETEAPIRKRMYKLYVEHRRKKTVAHILNQEGYRTRQGSKFSSSTVTRLLKDPIAKGIRIVNSTTSRTGTKTRKSENDWVMQQAPALISEELWNQVQLILNETAIVQPKNRKLRLFTGYVQCHCGGKMLAPSNSPKYICKDCKHKIPKDDLEAVFKEQLQEFVLSDNILEKVISQGSREKDQKERLLNVTQKEIKELKEKIDSLLTLHAKGQIPTEAFNQHHDEPYKRLQELLDTKEVLMSELTSFEKNTKVAEKIIIEAKDLYTKWDDFEQDEKRSIIETVVDMITIYPDSIEITIKRLAPSFQTDVRWGSLGCSSIPQMSFTLKCNKPSHGVEIDECHTLGEHLRRKRLHRNESQPCVAQKFSVSPDTISAWENNTNTPRGRYIPIILHYLEYTPLFNLTGTSLSKKIQQSMYVHGLTERECARKMKIKLSVLRETIIS